MRMWDSTSNLKAALDEAERAERKTPQDCSGGHGAMGVAPLVQWCRRCGGIRLKKQAWLLPTRARA